MVISPSRIDLFVLSEAAGRHDDRNIDGRSLKDQKGMPGYVDENKY
jgi:hypothetical protein